MAERDTLLRTLERLTAGPRDAVLTLAALVAGLEARSYAFIIAILDLPNCIPTGLPLLSTVTGVPMLLFAVQDFLGVSTPWLPAFLGRRELPRGQLQAILQRARGPITRLENAVRPRQGWWVSGIPRSALLLAWILMIVILALPIPFDNLFPAWAILFFCLALIEGDGVMAMLGWLFTLITIAWTALLLIVGPWVVIGLIKSVL